MSNSRTPLLADKKHTLSSAARIRKTLGEDKESKSQLSNVVEQLIDEGTNLLLDQFERSTAKTAAIAGLQALKVNVNEINRSDYQEIEEKPRSHSTFRA